MKQTDIIEETTLVQELFEGDQTKQALEDYSLLRAANEMWDDSFMESPLSKALGDEVKGFSSAKLLLNHVLDGENTHK